MMKIVLACELRSVHETRIQFVMALLLNIYCLTLCNSASDSLKHVEALDHTVGNFLG